MMSGQGDEARSDPEGVLATDPGPAVLPELSEREQEELLGRLGRGVRAMLGDVLLDPLPRDFQQLLDVLERTERGRQVSGR